MHITVQIVGILQQMSKLPPVIEMEVEEGTTMGEALERVKARPGQNPFVGFAIIDGTRKKNDFVLRDNDVVSVYPISVSG